MLLRRVGRFLKRGRVLKKSGEGSLPTGLPHDTLCVSPSSGWAASGRRGFRKDSGNVIRVFP